MLHCLLISCFCSIPTSPSHFSAYKVRSSATSLFKMQASLDEKKVLFEHKLSNKLGIVALNRPSALNAADLEMTSSIRQEWKIWEQSDSVGTVIIRSSGERAFCSGGDVKAMAAVITREPDSKLPEKALASEYLLLSEMSNSKIFKIAVMDGAAPLLCTQTTRP